MRRFLLPLLALLSLLLATSATAAPAPRIKVKLQINEGYYPLADSTSPFLHRGEACTVTLRRNATAYDALVAGKAQHCLRSYKVTKSSLGHYLHCVDGRCETLGFSWALYLSRELTCSGLDGIRLRDGDTLGLSYESWGTAAALALCPGED